MAANPRRCGVLLALMFAVTPVIAVLSQEESAEKKLVDFSGVVMSLADFLAKQNIKLDADAVPYSLILRTDAGKIHPLVKDAGSRMFFQDVALLKRPMRLLGRLVSGSEFLQVIHVRSVKEGKLHEVYYWCDICTIRGYEAGICDCCGGPMDRREVEVK